MRAAAFDAADPVRRRSGDPTWMNVLALIALVYLAILLAMSLGIALGVMLLHLLVVV